MVKQAEDRKGGRRMRATAEHSTVLIEQFPVALRLRLRAKAIQERRRLHEVFIEVVERGLAAAEADQRKKERR
jgi:hypothetical protein